MEVACYSHVALKCNDCGRSTFTRFLSVGLEGDVFSMVFNLAYCEACDSYIFDDGMESDIKKIAASARKCELSDIVDLKIL